MHDQESLQRLCFEPVRDTHLLRQARRLRQLRSVRAAVLRRRRGALCLASRARPLLRNRLRIVLLQGGNRCTAQVPGRQDGYQFPTIVNLKKIRLWMTCLGARQHQHGTCVSLLSGRGIVLKKNRVASLWVTNA